MLNSPASQFNTEGEAKELFKGNRNETRPRKFTKVDHIILRDGI